MRGAGRVNKVILKTALDIFEDYVSGSREIHRYNTRHFTQFSVNLTQRKANLYEI